MTSNDFFVIFFGASVFAAHVGAAWPWSLAFGLAGAVILLVMDRKRQKRLDAK